jgi:hypothetical protein
MNGIFNDDQLTESQRQWLYSHHDDDLEQLNTMAESIVDEFIQYGIKNPETIAEVATLAPVLSKSSFKILLDEFINKLHRSVLLQEDILVGLGELIRNAPIGSLDPDDLVQILVTLHTRLELTHQQSTNHTLKLIQATSYILDGMVDCEIRGLNREQLHEPLSDFLKGLKDHSDPSLAYQAAYAYQALQHVPDDETLSRKVLRRTGKVIQGVSGVLSAVKSINIMELIKGLQNIHEGASEFFNSNNKRGWYLVLRGLDSLIQEGRFVECEKLIRGAPYRDDPIFQYGVCLQVGSIAMDGGIEYQTRQSAVLFLRDLYNEVSEENDNNGRLRQWIL